jgi:hypothetical protein
MKGNRKKGAARRKTSPYLLNARLRAIQAAQLRIDGKEFHEIAEILGYGTPTSAREAMIRGFDALGPVENLKRSRRVWVIRLERVAMSHYKHAFAGPDFDLASATLFVKLVERISRVVGMEQDKTNVNVSASFPTFNIVNQSAPQRPQVVIDAQPPPLPLATTDHANTAILDNGNTVPSLSDIPANTGENDKVD